MTTRVLHFVQDSDPRDYAKPPDELGLLSDIPQKRIVTYK